MRALAASLAIVGGIALARGPLGARDADYQTAVMQAHTRYQSDASGKVSDSVASLSGVSANVYAVVIVRVDGRVWEAGDASVPLVLGSIGAPFTAALAAEQQGAEVLSSTVGAVAGTAPVPQARNPGNWSASPNDAFGTRGALATLALVRPQHDPEGKWRALLANFNGFAGAELAVHNGAYRAATPIVPRVPENARDLSDKGRLLDDEQPTVDLYLRQSSLALTTRDLAVMAATLANDGMNPLTRQQVVSTAVAQSIQGQLASTRSGTAEWMVKAGIRANASASGAIIVVLPGRLGLAVYSPPLDASGVSVRGQRAIKYLSQALFFNP
jgi:glutaminase